MFNLPTTLTPAHILCAFILSILAPISLLYITPTDVSAADQTNSSLIDQSKAANSQSGCANSKVITMGYKYGEGANPFALVGKCIKLKNVTPFQYISAREALVTWHHRGEQGTVFIEDKSDTGLSINNAKILVGKSVGTYEYTTVLGSKAIIPHVVIE